VCVAETARFEQGRSSPCQYGDNDLVAITAAGNHRQQIAAIWNRFCSIMVHLKLD
jgi:hypothetical protein